MGVPLFFQRIIREHFPAAVSKKRPRCTTLAIDFAGIEHTVLAEVRQKYPRWTIRLYLEHLEKAIVNLVKGAGVQGRLIICRDGMPPLGKMMQQRQRRYRSVLEDKLKKSASETTSEEWKEPFTNIALSPGTEISIMIDDHLNSFISRNVGTSILPQKVIFSGYRVPGEGEHKIIEYVHEILEEEPKKLKSLMNDLVRAHHLRMNESERFDILAKLRLNHWESLSNEVILSRLKKGREFLPEGFYRKFADLFSINESIIIYGLDADLIFLSLPIEGRVFLWRHNDYINQNIYFRNLKKHGDEVRAKREARIIEDLYLDLKTLRDLLRRDNIGVSEFIMAGFIFGNDFLPFLPGFNIVSDVSEHYLNNLIGRRFADPFNLEEFQDYLRSFEFLLPQLYGRVTGSIVPEEERDKLQYPSRLNPNNFEEEWKQRMLFQRVIPSNTVIEKDGEQFIFPSAEDDLHQYSVNYIKTILWCYRYYIDHRSVSWEWVYYNYWAPPIANLLKINSNDLDLNDLDFKYPKFNLAAQLLLILPRDLYTKEPNALIPKKLQIFQKEFSPVFDFYPVGYNVIRDGVNREHDGFTFLPQIDYVRFVDTMNKVEFSIKDNNLYGFSSVKRFEGALLHKSLFEQPQQQEEDDREEFVKPSPLFRFEDLWKKKATELFGSSLMKRIIPYEERHFSDLVKIERIEVNMPNIEIKRKIF